MAILYIFIHRSPGFRFSLRISSLTDKTSTESGGNKPCFDQIPVESFLERLTLLYTLSGMKLDLSHISGDRNEAADALSR